MRDQGEELRKGMCYFSAAASSAIGCRLLGLCYNLSCADVLTYCMPMRLFLTPGKDVGSTAEEEEYVHELDLSQCLTVQCFAENS